MGHQKVRVQEERTERLVAMGQMAASLAHEIRNPLGSMELYCSLLKKDLVSDPAMLGLAEQIHLGIHTVNRIIANCLQFARDVSPKPREISNMKAFIDEALGNLEHVYLEQNIDIKIVIEHDEIVSFDPYLLNQVLVNLLANSFEAIISRQEKAKDIIGKLCIDSSINENGDWFLTVSDNGIGLPEEEREKIYDPFFSTKEEGTGLGLAVVHSIIVAHEGRIEFRENESGGTTAIVAIPAAVPDTVMSRTAALA